MDEIVKAALKKWPNVPACVGWLALDARGEWYMRDDRVQAAGAFPHIKGSMIRHDKLREFIGRNYESDHRGCWFFQNGPQQVFVELEVAPWVWRLTARDGAAPQVESHTGRAAQVASVWLDEADRLYLATDLGLGLVHTLDMDTAADAVERGQWLPQPTTAGALLQRFGVCLSPQKR